MQSWKNKHAAATWAYFPMYDTLEQLAEAANAQNRRNKEKLGKIMNLRRQAQREEELLYKEQLIEYKKAQEVAALVYSKNKKNLNLLQSSKFMRLS